MHLIDRLGQIMVWILSAAIAIATVVAIVSLVIKQPWLAFGWAVFVTVMSIQLIQWLKRRHVNLTFSDTGLTREGNYGWQVTWPQITSTETRQIATSVGRLPGLLLFLDPATSINPDLVARVRTAWQYRKGRPENQPVLLIPGTDESELRAVKERIDQYRTGTGYAG